MSASPTVENYFLQLLKMPQSKLVLQFILDLTYRFEMIVMRIDFLSYKESCQYLSVLHLVHINIAHFIRIDRNMVCQGLT
jgi:hypothetical protein